jgi:hypothetical protein
VEILSPSRRVENWRAHGRWRVTSRALSIARWVHSSTMVTFPVPASSNRAGGFPALGFPVCFAPRVMRPIVPGALSALSGEPGNQPEFVIEPAPTPPLPAEAVSVSGAHEQSPKPSGRFSLRLAVYPPPQVSQTNGCLIISPLLSVLSEEAQTAGPLCSTDIAPCHRSYGPLRNPLLFGRLPGVAGYTAYLAPPFSRREEEGFSSCLARPGHRAAANTPPESSNRLSQPTTLDAAFTH